MIRRCRSKADFALADALCRACGPRPSPRPSKFAPPDVERAAVWVADVQEGPGLIPAGFAAAYVQEDGALNFATCGVLRGYRGRGLLRQLLRAAAAWGRREGCELAVTYTAANNWPSMTNLMRCGYRVVGYRADAQANGGGWVDLERRL